MGSLHAKNLGLLGKWWWRFRKSGEALWVRVIKGIWGESGGVGRSKDESQVTGVWGEIVRVGFEIESKGINFVNSFRRKVGKGDEVKFWEDVWVGDLCLKDKFSRLYRAEENRKCTVADKGVWEGEEWFWRWSWRRSLRGTEEEQLTELISLLSIVSLSTDAKDDWTWALDPGGAFTVRRLSSMLDEVCLQPEISTPLFSWNSLIPQKVNLCVWRAVLGRLPSRTNLASRGLEIADIRCPLCQSGEETVDHIMARCSFASCLWQKVLAWWQLPRTTPLDTKDALSMSWSQGLPGWIQKIWQAVCCVTCWIIWKARNSYVFKDTSVTGMQMLGDIQFFSFFWISHRSKRMKLAWVDWLLNPCQALQNCI